MPAIYSHQKPLCLARVKSMGSGAAWDQRRGPEHTLDEMILDRNDPVKYNETTNIG